MDTIKTGKYKVISSGSFIASEKDKSEISFKRNDEKITLEFIFKEKKENEGVHTSSRGSKKDLIITFGLPIIKNSLGEGLVKPIQFARFGNGDLLYLYLWIRKIGEPYVEIVYSIFVEEIKK